MSTATAPMFYGPRADNTCNGACTNCGKCCSDILPLTPWDISRIKEYVRKHAIEPIPHELNPHWNPPIDDTCPFFDPSRFDGHHCLIYPARPIICRYYPCRGFADPMLHIQINRLIMAEAMEQPSVRKDPSIFMMPRSLRYSIWPNRFPEYKEINLKFQSP